VRGLRSQFYHPGRRERLQPILLVCVSTALVVSMSLGTALIHLVVCSVVGPDIKQMTAPSPAYCWGTATLIGLVGTARQCDLLGARRREGFIITPRSRLGQGHVRASTHLLARSGISHPRPFPTQLMMTLACHRTFECCPWTLPYHADLPLLPPRNVLLCQ
jgi:hypothetical protein